jgi:hypothetical protein
MAEEHKTFDDIINGMVSNLENVHPLGRSLIRPATITDQVLRLKINGHFYRVVRETRTRIYIKKMCYAEYDIYPGWKFFNWHTSDCRCNHKEEFIKKTQHVLISRLVKFRIESNKVPNS